MIPDNVTLIVKAPNQQIEDQNIECLSSWTVKQLKGHLAEVYPSKPTAGEQKIIYSGQLLEDGVVLRDVLRSYESELPECTHTVHLVCAGGGRRRAAGERPVGDRPVGDRPGGATPSADGLRRRDVEASPLITESAPRPEMRQNDQNHTAEMHHYLQSFMQHNHGRVPPYPANVGYNIGANLPMPTDAASMQSHMMMMQQAYMQYMQQYANMWQAGGNVAPGAQPVNVVNEVPQVEAEAAPAPADEPEEQRRDWLDHVYAASRLLVLVSLVHLYSSFYRLLLVLMLCVAAYLHQVGFFRELANPPANPQPIPQPPQPQPPQANEANNANNAVNLDNAVPPPAATPPPTGDDQQSLLSVTWMIFSSFFASLIPEINH